MNVDTCAHREIQSDIMIQNDIPDAEEHKFLLRISKMLWERFAATLPESISATEKIEKLILEYVIDYENAVGAINAEKNKSNKDYRMYEAARI